MFCAPCFCPTLSSQSLESKYQKKHPLYSWTLKPEIRLSTLNFFPGGLSKRTVEYEKQSMDGSKFVNFCVQSSKGWNQISNFVFWNSRSWHFMKDTKSPLLFYPNSLNFLKLRSSLSKSSTKIWISPFWVQKTVLKKFFLLLSGLILIFWSEYRLAIFKKPESHNHIGFLLYKYNPLQVKYNHKYNSSLLHNEGHFYPFLLVCFTRCLEHRQYPTSYQKGSRD